MQEEIWREIGTNKYQISNLGNVRGYKGDKPLIPGIVSAATVRSASAKTVFIKTLTFIVSLPSTF
jgi:hypothetical protein